MQPPSRSVAAVRIALFDQVNEVHVCDALAMALQSIGHEVHVTGAVWRGHRFATHAEDVARINRAVDEVLAAGCGALLNFRASALDAAQVARLRRAGVATAVWLPDDPVLYGVTYRHVVDAYDHVLHCGGLPILEFYARQGHQMGVNFPFWVDPARWAHAWCPQNTRGDLVFIGNLHGPAKRGRYERLARAHARLSIYGICPDDPLAMHRGELHGIDALCAVLPLFRAGLNLPQRFAEYAGSAYDFVGLAELGGFELPSRVVQYAALGLPIITLDKLPSIGAFPHSLQAPDMSAALQLADALAADPDAALDLSRRARAEVESHFSAASRARFLTALLSGGVAVSAMPADARATYYRQYPGNHP